MELRVLRYYLTVAREENITRAADILHITQPTLSRQLSQLEEELGAQLMIRGKRKITLTEDGLRLRRRAEELVELAEKTEQEFGGASPELSGVISIGSAESSAAKFLPKLLEQFSAEHPLVQYDLLSGNADQLRERLDTGLLDAALLLEPVDVTRYDFLRLQETDRWGVLMPARSPLSEKSFVDAADLRELPLLMPRRDSVQRELSAWFGGSFEHLHIFSTHNLIKNAALLVEHGLGYAVTIEGAVDVYDRERFCFRPLSPELTVGAVLVWKKYRSASPAVSAFLQCARLLTGKNSPSN